MSPSHVLEPTYQTIKVRLMEGAWPLGARLEATKLADDLGVSMTPVRDSLNRLVGERLVDLRAGGGFQVARFNELTLRDMFEFNATLLIFAVLTARPQGVRAGPKGRAEYVHRCANLFESIAVGCGNRAVTEAVRALNDRLHATRRLDPHMFGDAPAELERLETDISKGASSEHVREHLIAFHDRRKEAASHYIRLLEQG